MVFGMNNQTDRAVPDLNRYIELLRNTPPQQRCDLKTGTSYYLCVADNIQWEERHRPLIVGDLSLAYLWLRAGKIDAALTILPRISHLKDLSAIANWVTDNFGAAAAEPLEEYIKSGHAAGPLPSNRTDGGTAHADSTTSK